MATIKARASSGSCGGYSNYLKQEEKTDKMLIDTKDCTINFARDFSITKNNFKKTEGVQFHEIIQSFVPGETTAEQAHEIGKQFIKHEKYKDFQVAIVTHKDKEHIHNHIIINSVSHITGEKYQQNLFDLKNLKEHSNNLCRERGLSVLDLEKKAEKYINIKENEILKTGRTSHKEELREWIKEGKEQVKSIDELKDYLEKNYKVETKIQNKNIKFKHPDEKNYMNGRKLGAEFEKGELEIGILRGQAQSKSREETGRTSATTREQTEYITRNDYEEYGADIISKNEYIRSGTDESRKSSAQTDIKQLHEQLSEIRGIDKQFNIEEQRRIKERDKQLKADAEREKRRIEEQLRLTEQRNREKAKELEEQQRRTKSKSISDDFSL